MFLSNAFSATTSSLCDVTDWPQDAVGPGLSEVLQPDVIHLSTCALVAASCWTVVHHPVNFVVNFIGLDLASFGVDSKSAQVCQKMNLPRRFPLPVLRCPKCLRSRTFWRSPTQLSDILQLSIYSDVTGSSLLQREIRRENRFCFGFLSRSPR